jgi:hypothetical protein
MAEVVLADFPARIAFCWRREPNDPENSPSRSLDTVVHEEVKRHGKCICMIAKD